MFSTKDKNIFREKLLNLLRRLNRSRDDVKQEALQPGGGEASGGISNVPLHLGDFGSHEADTEVDLHLIENEEHLIKEVSLALERIEQGTFGECESCGKKIGKERLQVLPYIRFCIRCAEELEGK
jgi:RNA polymerase-binding protein DksA